MGSISRGRAVAGQTMRLNVPVEAMGQQGLSSASAAHDVSLKNVKLPPSLKLWNYCETSLS